MSMVHFEYKNVFESQVRALAAFCSEINEQPDLQQGQELAKR